MTWKIKRIFAIVSGVALGALSLTVGTKEFLRSRQLVAHGKTTQGQVTEVVNSASFGSRSRLNYLRVKFDADQPREQRVMVSKAVYDSVHEGDTVTVHYLPEDPGYCQIGETAEVRYKSIVWGLVFIFGAGYLVVYFKRPANESEAVENIAGDAARNIAANVKTLALEKFEYVPAKAENFKNLDLAFYNSVQHGLEAQGFVFVDDQENLTLRQRSNLHTFLRYMLGPDQSTMAIMYHFNKGLKSSKVVDFETWFSDGCFICTSNAEMAGKLDTPPEVNALRVAAGTPWETLLENHYNRMGEYLAAHAGVSPVRLEGMADIHRAQAEQQRIKSEFRKRAGLSKAELERIAGGSSPALDKIHSELAKQTSRAR